MYDTGRSLQLAGRHIKLNKIQIAYKKIIKSHTGLRKLEEKQVPNWLSSLP